MVKSSLRHCLLYLEAKDLRKGTMGAGPYSGIFPSSDVRPVP